MLTTLKTAKSSTAVRSATEAEALLTTLQAGWLHGTILT